MKYIGVDYGTKKVGIAISDDEGTFAFPHNVVSNNGLVKYIETFSSEISARGIVIGESRDLSGNPNEIMDSIYLLKNELEKRGFVVYLEPEHWTSAEAGRIQGRTKTQDASAAAIILQNFLDKHPQQK